MNYSTPALIEELAQEAKRITEQAEAAEDHRTALAGINARCRILELGARLRGEVDESSQTNVLSVHLDPDTAKRMAETYLERRKSLKGDSE